MTITRIDMNFVKVNYDEGKEEQLYWPERKPIKFDGFSPFRLREQSAFWAIEDGIMKGKSEFNDY